MSAQCLGQFGLYLIVSTKVIALKIENSGSMDTVELHRDILQPWGQLETPGPVTISLLLDVQNGSIFSEESCITSRRLLFKGESLG